MGNACCTNNFLQRNPLSLFLNLNFLYGLEVGLETKPHPLRTVVLFIWETLAKVWDNRKRGGVAFHIWLHWWRYMPCLWVDGAGEVTGWLTRRGKGKRWGRGKRQEDVMVRDSVISATKSQYYDIFFYHPLLSFFSTSFSCPFPCPVLSGSSKFCLCYFT